MKFRVADPNPHEMEFSLFDNGSSIELHARVGGEDSELLMEIHTNGQVDFHELNKPFSDLFGERLNARKK
jgi:hypothetical protein